MPNLILNIHGIWSKIIIHTNMIALSRHILLLFLFSKHYFARKPSITCQGLIQFDGILTCLLTIKNVLFEKNSNHIMKSRNLESRHIECFFFQHFLFQQIFKNCVKLTFRVNCLEMAIQYLYSIET